MRRFDLRSLHFGAASEARCTLAVDVEPFVLSGIEYAVEGRELVLDLLATRVGTRLTLQGEGDAVVTGPCQRCLGDARILVAVAPVDYVRDGESEGDAADAYVRRGSLDLELWVRDAIAEALPGQMLCRDDCLGLCAVCGADLNEAGADHGH
jgi:uncharacterized protein